MSDKFTCRAADGDSETDISAGFGSNNGDNTFTLGVQYSEDGCDYALAASTELGYDFTSNKLSSADIAIGAATDNQFSLALGLNGHMQKNGEETVTTAGLKVGMNIMDGCCPYFSSLGVNPYVKVGYGHSTKDGSGLMYGAGVGAYKTVGTRVTLGSKLGWDNFNKWSGGFSIGLGF